MASSQASTLGQLHNILSKEVLNTVQTFFEIKVVNVESTTFFCFLLDRVHELFHYFVKKASCCNTSTPCASIAIQGTLTKVQFNILYGNDPSIQPIHEKKNNGWILQHCICPLSPNHATDGTYLDFTLINCLIKTCRRTPYGHPQWLKDIIEVRNHLSHPGDQSSISEQMIQDWWIKLEQAAVNMAETIGKAYQKGVQSRISDMKTSKSHLEELMNALKTRDDDLVQIVAALQNIGIRVGDVPFQITATEFVEQKPQINLATPVSSSDKGEVPFQITKTEFLKEEPQIGLATQVQSSTIDPHKCIVVWTFSSSGDWDVEKMQQKLEQMNRLGDFDIQFVYRGSLILHTQADPDILSTAERFKESIEEFLFLFANLLQMQAPKADSLAIAIAIWHEKIEEYVKEDDSMPRKPVDERDRKIDPGLSKSEADFQKETAQEVMKEETLATSALQAEDTTHAQAPVNKSQLPRELKQIKQIDMSGDFTDCTAVDNIFVICDYYNKRLVITDSDGSNIRDIPLSGPPYYITTIDNTTVAVNIGSRDIDIINMYSGDRIRRTSINGFVRGLTYSEPHLYISVHGKGIQVIDLHGNNITTLPIERNVYHMTINKQSIYYTDNDTVSCVKPSEEKIWTFEDPMVKDIRGLTTDDTNIYVICFFSHTVFVISPDGKQVRQLLSESDGLKYPRGMCYNGKSKTLMVCKRHGPAYLFNIVK